MDNSTIHISILEDDAMIRMLLVEAISSFNCRITQAATVQEFTATQAHALADIYIIDVRLPDGNGIEVCRQIRQRDQQRSKIIFASANEDLDTRLMAYEAGADDYLVKPCSLEEITHKVGLCIEQTHADRAIETQAKYAHDTALTAMTTLGEMGVVIEFMREMFTCTNEADLPQVIASACNKYGLSAAIEIQGYLKAAYGGTHGEVSELARTLLHRCRDMDKILQINSRLLIHSKRVAILVTGLPINDADKVGRIRDHLALIVDAAEMRLIGLEDKIKIEQQHRIMQEAVASLLQIVDSIYQDQQGRQGAIKQAAIDYTNDLYNTFVHLMLTDKQESLLLNQAQQATRKMIHLQTQSEVINNGLQPIIQQLQSIIKAH